MQMGTEIWFMYDIFMSTYGVVQSERERHEQLENPSGVGTLFMEDLIEARFNLEQHFLRNLRKKCLSMDYDIATFQPTTRHYVNMHWFLQWYFYIKFPKF